MKPCALCTSRIEKLSIDEKHPLFLVKYAEPTPHENLCRIASHIREAFPDNYKFIFADSRLDFEKLDDAKLAEIGLKRIEKRKEEKK